MNFDNQFMIHVAAEVTLIAGLGFWMKKRADASDLKIEELEAKLQKYEEVLQQQQNMIARHENMLRQLFGQPDMAASKPKNLPANVNPQPPQPQPPQQVKQEPEEDTEDIDNILKQELAKENEDSIEIETAVDDSQEKSINPTALKQRKADKKKTLNGRTT